MESFTIGQLARAADVNVETIRYYQRLKLLTRSAAGARGWRRYSGSDLLALLFVRRAQRLGFTLKEISALLAHASDPANFCDRARPLIRARTEAIEQKIRDLTAMREELSSLALACAGPGSDESCSILRRLTGDENSTAATAISRGIKVAKKERSHR